MARHIDIDPAVSFGAVAGMYEAGRPTYPTAPVEWLLDAVLGSAQPARVADVGAGTGKLTRTIAAVGCDVVAVDPDGSMLTALREVVPGVETFVGSAEALPLESDAFDAVLVGQAWHWVDPVKASSEIGRVLRPGGALGLIWNLRDDSQPWVRELNGIMPEGPAQETLSAGPPQVAAPFGAAQYQSWRWSQLMTRSDLGNVMRSRSFYITAPPDQRGATDAALDRLCADLGLVEDGAIELPYVTHAYRFLRS